MLEELGLGQPTDDMKASVVAASGSDETRSYLPRDVALISESIKERAITVIDVIKALAKRGFEEEAENLLKLVRLRVSGDYLQTSAIVRDGRVLSAVNDPNDYLGPGTGYRVSKARRDEIVAIRDVLDPRGSAESRNRCIRPPKASASAYRTMGPAAGGNDPREVVIGISPAFGIKLFQTVAGHPLSAILRELIAGIAEEGARARVVRMKHTADTSFLGLSAARIAGAASASASRPRAPRSFTRRTGCPTTISNSSPIRRSRGSSTIGAWGRTPPSTPGANCRSRSSCRCGARRWARAIMRACR